MRSLDESQRILNRALELASKDADHVEASLSGGRSGVTRFTDNVISQATDLNADRIHFRLIADGRDVQLSSTDLTDAGISKLTSDALARAKEIPKSTHEICLPSSQEYTALDSFDPETDRATVIDRMAIVGSAIIRAHAHGLAASGFLATGLGTPSFDSSPNPDVYAVHNTEGLFAYHAVTHASFSVSMLDERHHTGWAKASSFMLAAINAEGIAEVAAQKACAPGELRQLRSGRYRCIIEPAAMAQLIQHLGATSGADLMHTGGSYLSAQEGKQITSDKISIRDDFSHEQLRGMPFDVQGLARRSVSLIDKGVAQGPVYALSSAQLAKKEPTGHGVYDSRGVLSESARHLVMDGGETDLVDLVNDCEQAVLISGFGAVRMLDSRKLTLAGTTRDGTFLVRGGQVVCPIQNMSFSVDLFDLFDLIEEMSTVIACENTVVPAVRVSEFALRQL